MEPTVLAVVLKRLDSIDRKLDDVVTWKAIKYIGGALVGAIVIVEFILHQVTKV